MHRSSRQAWQEFLRRPIFEPQPKPNWLEILGFLILAFLGRCFAVGFFVYLGCSLFLIIMAFFSSHADVLFRIGFPAAEKAAIYLSVVGGVVWSAIDVCRDFVQAKRRRNWRNLEEDDDLEEEDDEDDDDE